MGRSKHKQNITLNLKSQNDTSNTQSPAAPTVVPVALKTLAAEPNKARDVTPKNQKEVVYFVFNGHEWEAHEVLGIKSGLGLDHITKHYQHLIKTSDPSTFEFYDAAFTAILKLKGNRW